MNFTGNEFDFNIGVYEYVAGKLSLSFRGLK